MPAVALSRLATYVLVGVFLIPLGMSSLRGLTHTLTCTESIGTPFQAIISDHSDPLLTSATTLTADEPPLLCGGLLVNVAVAPSNASGRVLVSIAIENAATNDWHGSIELEVNGVRIPLAFGLISANTVATESIELDLPVGTSEFDGAVLVGP